MEYPDPKILTYIIEIHNHVQRRIHPLLFLCRERIHTKVEYDSPTFQLHPLDDHLYKVPRPASGLSSNVVHRINVWSHVSSPWAVQVSIGILILAGILSLKLLGRRLRNFTEKPRTRRRNVIERKRESVDSVDIFSILW